MSSADYRTYYESQMGGAQLRVFRGGIQAGAGLGDILKGVLRFLVPVALGGLGSFAGKTLMGARGGKTLGEAARTAVGPALGVMAGAAAPTVMRFVNTYIPGMIPGMVPSVVPGTVSGMAPAVAPGVVQEQAKPDQQRGGALFDGVEGIPTTAKAITQYKKAAKPSRGTKRKSTTTSVRYNF